MLICICFYYFYIEKKTQNKNYKYENYKLVNEVQKLKSDIQLLKHIILKNKTM